MALYLTLLLIAFGACSETSVPKEEELARYPEFKPFIQQMASFRGIRHKIDEGDYSFEYTTSIHGPEAFFEKVDSTAAKEGWKIKAIGDRKRIYTSAYEVYSGAREQIDLAYDKDRQTVHFRSRVIYSVRR